MSELARAAGLATLAFARNQTVELLKAVPSEQWLHQPFAGANHAMWIAGHLAREDDEFVTLLKPGESRLPEHWVQLFGTKSKPAADAALYPSVEEMLEHLAGTRETLVAWFRSLSDAQLHSPLPEGFTGFATSFAALMSSLAWHEGLHTGQLTVVRKSLGLEPVYM